MKKILISLSLLIGVVACKKQPIATNLNFDKAYVVNGGDRTISVINLEKQEVAESFELKTSNDRFPHHVYLSPDNQFLAVANPAYDFSKGHTALHGMTIPGGILKLDAKTGKAIHDIQIPMVNHNVAFSPDGSEMWTAKMSHSGKVMVYDRASGELKTEITVDADPSEVIFSKDGKYALVTCGESTFLNVIDVQSKELLKQIKVDNYPANVWPGYDNVVLVSNMQRKSVNFVDLEKFAVTDFLDLNFMPGNVAYNALLNELWVCNSMMNSVNIFKKVDGKWAQTAMVKSEGDPHMVKFFDNDKRALLINQGANTLKFINCETKEVEKEIAVGEKPNGIAVMN
ncbi:40-residue YVTN family beta-propeller repeat-containing protein [Spirosomataceae bacterium TFI 002]|nr:40-residue YVTN family beta-propeller repeat-containing protein [Spirosomataceae bacterium TFI 002]